MTNHLQSFLLKTKTKQRLEAQWDSLSSTAKQLILGFLAEGKKYEHKAINAAAKNNPNFLQSFKHKLAKSQASVLEKIETEEQQNSDQILLKDLGKI